MNGNANRAPRVEIHVRILNKYPLNSTPPPLKKTRATCTWNLIPHRTWTRKALELFGQNGTKKNREKTLQKRGTRRTHFRDWTTEPTTGRVSTQEKTKKTPPPHSFSFFFRSSDSSRSRNGRACDAAPRRADRPPHCEVAAAATFPASPPVRPHQKKQNINENNNKKKGRRKRSSLRSAGAGRTRWASRWRRRRRRRAVPFRRRNFSICLNALGHFFSPVVLPFRSCAAPRFVVDRFDEVTAEHRALRNEKK